MSAVPARSGACSGRVCQGRIRRWDRRAGTAESEATSERSATSFREKMGASDAGRGMVSVPGQWVQWHGGMMGRVRSERRHVGVGDDDARVKSVENSNEREIKSPVSAEHNETETRTMNVL